MHRQSRFVSAESEYPLRDAAEFVALTVLIAAGAYLPLLASDLGWINTTLPPGLQVVGILSPGIATLLLQLYDDGAEGLRPVVDGLAAWRFGRFWWGVTLALPPAFAAMYLGASIALGLDVSPEPMQMLVEAGVAFFPFLLLNVVLAAGEEIGWRGQLLPLLQTRLRALTASLVVGVIWAVWHVPVFYGAGIEGWAFPLRLVSVIAGAVMYTWLFNNTGGSVLAVTLLHAGTNVWGPLLGPAPTGKRTVMAFTAVNVLLAVLLVSGFGWQTLTGRPDRDADGRAM